MPIFGYPRPKTLPDIVRTPIQELLAKLQSLLSEKAPKVLDSLEPGLDDAQIDEVEKEFGFKLGKGLRALYKWRNGMLPAIEKLDPEKKKAYSEEVRQFYEEKGFFGVPPGLDKKYGLESGTDSFVPGHTFLPLNKAASALREVYKDTQEQAWFQRFICWFSRHKRNWIHVLDDGAGDGYFYDPGRKEEGGAFFFHFTETGNYIWFPSLNNFILAVIECYETGSFYWDEEENNVVEDFDKAGEIIERYGTLRENL